MNLSGLFLMLSALGLGLAMVLFVWWGARINRHDLLTNPVHAKPQEPTDHMLCEHDCECMASRL
jgi:hypothetical protein